MNHWDVALESSARDLRRRCALVLGITGPDPGLGEVELGAPAPLAQAPVLAGGLAVSLAAYGYRDVVEALGKPVGGVAAAADVQARVDAALADPGLVVVHLLTHGLQGCSYFSYCGGGAASNKFFELGSTRGTRTSYCENRVQHFADVMVQQIDLPTPRRREI